MLGYLKDSIESWALYYIDKGNSFDVVLAALTGIGNHQYFRTESDPEFETEEAKATLNRLLKEKILAKGSMFGWNNWLVVREWMPETAASLEE